MTKKITIALWDSAFLTPIAEAFQSSTSGFEVIVTSVEKCEQLALAGMVDIALMPSMSVLLHEDDLEVFSSGAISSWKFPYASLALNCSIGDAISTVEYHPSDQSLAVIGKVVLNEHYQQSPQFELSEQPAPKGPGSGIIQSETVNGAPLETTMDLGQEWFELTGYPMVWGLFACAKGGHSIRIEDALQTVLAAFKFTNDADAAAADDPTTQEFYSGDLRVGYDDLVTASLTELSQFLYFYNVIEEPVIVPVVFGDETE